MVFQHFFNDPLFKAFFFTTDESTKPPREVYPIYEEDSAQPTGWEIVYALAGFRPDEIKVWSKKRELYVEGDNTKDGDDTRSKFKLTFKHSYKVSNELDLAKLSVNFENGLLKISLPVSSEAESEKKVYFGK